MPDTDSPLLLERSGAVLLLTLNRPERRNALSPDLVDALTDALAAALSDDEVHVLVLTGAGTAFCAGLDLEAYGAAGADRSAVTRVIRAFGQVPKPVVAAVNGVAATGGFELVLACDLVVAATGTRFLDTHIKIGAMPGAGMSVRLPQAIGIRRAKELSLTAGAISTEEAHAAGLVNRLVAPDEVVPTALELATTMAGFDLDALIAMKQVFDTVQGPYVGAGLEAETIANARRKWAGQRAFGEPRASKAT